MGFFTDVLNSAGVSPSQEMDAQENTSQKENTVPAHIIDGLDSATNNTPASDYDETGSTDTGVDPLSVSSFLNPDITAAESVQVAGQDSIAPVPNNPHLSELELSQYNNKSGDKTRAHDSFKAGETGALLNDGTEEHVIVSTKYDTKVTGFEDNNQATVEMSNALDVVDNFNVHPENSIRHHNQENPYIHTNDYERDDDVDHENVNQAIELDKHGSLDAAHQELSSRAHLSNISDKGLEETIAGKAARNREDFDKSALKSNATILNASEKKLLIEESEQLSSTGIQDQEERSPKINKAELTFMHDPQAIEAQRNGIETNDTQHTDADSLRPKISIGHIDVIIVGAAPAAKESKKPGFNTSTYKRSYLGGV